MNRSVSPPFDQARLDRVMGRQGIDLLLATSEHNVRYLTGGHRFFFFEHTSEAIGASRYLPFVGYPKDHAEQAFYVGAPLEEWQHEFEPLWFSDVGHVSFRFEGTAEGAVERIRRLGLDAGVIAIERAFLPDAAREALDRALPEATFVEAFEVLEELRAIKDRRELDFLQRASEGIVDSMLAVIDAAEPGITTAEIAERMRLEQTRRGLTFNYCWVSTGRSSNMAPSEVRWKPGQVVCIDSAGQFNGYIGDLTRMGCMGAPTELMEQLLAEVDAVQQAARAVVAPGHTGREIFDEAAIAQRDCQHASEMVFAAHGMGLVVHEAPRISDALQPPYEAAHRDRPLEPGFVLSIETEIMNPEAGFVKLEDTVVVTDSGCEAFGDGGRGWNVPATMAPPPAAVRR